MYPWYRDSVSQLGQFPNPLPTTIKTETGYNDCMLALDYAAQSKKAFVWSPTGGDSQQGHNAQQGQPGSIGGKTGAPGCGPGGGGGGGGGGTGPGGPGGQPQGLVHWMSVMAEHMNNAGGNPHHDGVHYMWNGGVEQSGPQTKDMEYSWSRQSIASKQGYEAKMNSLDPSGHHMHKGGEEGALFPPRSASSSSSASPPSGAALAAHQAMLVVPQPINVAKMGGGGSVGGAGGAIGQPGVPGHPANPMGSVVTTANGTGVVRKYTCKMCPTGRGRKRGGINKGRDGLGWHAIDHGNPEIFGSKADLQMHTQLHMREAKPYKCSQCSKTFANSSYLSQHTRIHLGIKPYRCEICQRKFTQLSHLQQHIRTHTGDKPYKCRHPGCNKAFSQLSNLQSHSRCHQTDKPYKCNSCYKCFVDEPSLLEHIPKHKESKHLKTHICQYCGKSYTQETYLSKHMQKHAERTDKRPPILGLGRNALHQLGAHANNNNVADQSAGPPPHPQQHAYWPKVSPDTANSIVDAITQHEACLQQQQQQQQQQQSNGVLSEHHMAHHRALMEHHRQMNGGGEPRPTGDSEQQHQQPTAPPTPTPQQSNGYDALGIKAPPSSTSAFTPIQAMGGLTSHHHLGHLNPHQLGMSPASRPAYIPYDTLSFSGHKMAASAAAGQLASPAPSAASFPNQLISLHQIRNYAHQPMVGEHLLAGLNKDKSQ